MTPLIQPTRDKVFAEDMIRRNMADYHDQLGMYWDSALFARQWRTFEAYQLILNACPVGLLCIDHDTQAYYIRELQVAPEWQRQALGTAAIRFTLDKAVQANISSLRLRVFGINPARGLYERMGFHVRKTVGDTHYMERPVF